jgi:integrase
MPKVRRLACRRPISEPVASLISTQRTFVREQFPATALSALRLFPRPTRNPDGVEPVATPQVAMAVRRWADRLPPLEGPDGEPYDASRIFMYAFRHTYAQRHADSGTPPDVLRDLMGHRQMATTQGYYQVTEQRKRRAVDALVNLACNKDGTSLSRAMDALVDEEYQRQQVGQVAVPMG